tara:strand:+ start:3056 stop:5866 length:2811 start_codon:yes stop_codon:yes gene_type:complete
MNTQLILYPQEYQGYFYTDSASMGEMIVDGDFFTTINNSTLKTGTLPIESHTIAQCLASQNAAGFPVNTWYRLVSDWGGTVSTTPVETSSKLVLNNHGLNAGVSGVFQKLSNVVPGINYTVTVDQTFTSALGSFLGMYVWHPNILTPGGISTYQYLPLTTNPIQFSFTAQDTEPIIVFVLQNFAPYAPTTLNIDNISVQANTSAPSLQPTDLVDGQVICDLYEEEDIPLTLSIDDFKNVAEQTKSYSKDFDLPATKRNNRIFDNMFDVTRADDNIIFNPYVTTKCVLKQDGFIIFEGNLRLINVKDKEGEISYNVNLYSEVIALASVLKDRSFRNLDFSELSHTYNKTSIKNSWVDALPLINPLTNPNEFAGAVGATTTSVLKYPFIDWQHQFIVGGQNTSTNSAAVGYPELTVLEEAFRPCIQVKYILDNIFAATDFRYTSEFFNTVDFKKLYMDFNWGSDVAPVVLSGSGTGHPDSAQQAVPSFTTIQTPNENFSDDVGYTSGVFTAAQDSQTYTINYNIYYTTIEVAWTLTYRWKWHRASLGVDDYIDETTVIGTSAPPMFPAMSGSFSRVLMAGDTLSMEWQSVDSPSTDIYTVFNPAPHPLGEIIVNTSAPAITTNIMLQTLRGEVGQWDFLKGLMNMFNLVSLADEKDPNNIIIEPYADIFINNSNSGNLNDLSLASRFDNKIYDWTDKIDVSEMELTPLTEINKTTTFKFVEDDDDYMFNRFKQIENGRLFGSKVWTKEHFDILEGEEEIVAAPFAATVCKALMSEFTLFVTPSIYAMNESGESEAFDNSPRILFNNGVKDTNITYYIPEQNGLSSENQPEFLQFTHLSAIPSSLASGASDFHFESQNLESSVGVAPIDNLFNTYWLPYINELYHADTRIMTLKVNLTPSDIATFRFYDTVMIKNRAFRVNKIEYKPNSLAKVEFILIP